jgi:hypothetical protein
VTGNPSDPAAKPQVSFEQFLLVLYVAAALIVTIQRGVYAVPSDFTIFRASFWHLISRQDLYGLRLDPLGNGFKYSPTFALLFAPFAILPFAVGLFVWNVLNAMALFFAFRMLYGDGRGQFAQALVFLSMLRSIQSTQSNSLVAALIILAFVCFERGWQLRGAAAVALGTVTKIFPLAALAFAISRPKPVRVILVSLGVVLLLVLLPLIVLTPGELLAQYRSWAAMESGEAAMLGSSVMAVLHHWGVTWPAWPIQLLGCVLVLGILLVNKVRWTDRQFQLQFLGFVLVFCVLFNHRSERQSAVIAVSGVIIWYLAVERAAWRTALLALVFALVVLVGSDAMPDVIKRALSPDVRFPIPLTVLWLAMLFDLSRRVKSRSETLEAG